MNTQIRGTLLNFFKELLNTETALNHEKGYLLTIKHYSPSALFQAISSNGSNISIKQFTQYFSDKTAVNQRQIYHVFQTFDHSRNGKISMQDFIAEMQLNTKNKKKRQKKSKKYVLQQTQAIQAGFIKFINILVRTCRILDVWRQNLQKVPAYMMFEDIDRQGLGFVGPNQLRQWFLRNGQQLTVPNSFVLHKILLRRYYQTVNLQVFCENIHPLEFGGYQGYQLHLNQQRQEKLFLKQQSYREALQKQKDYHRLLNNQVKIDQFHKQAVLTRQHQLEQRIAQEVQLYGQMKYQIRQKYQPLLTYQQFLLQEKQNLSKNSARIQLMTRQSIKKQVQYHQKIQKVEVLQAVQGFRAYQAQRNLKQAKMNDHFSIRDQSLNQTHRNMLQQKVRQHRILAGLQNHRFLRYHL